MGVAFDDGSNPVAHGPAPFPSATPIAGVNFDVSRRLDDSALDALVANGVSPGSRCSPSVGSHGST
jgi:hypothetical protein